MIIFRKMIYLISSRIVIRKLISFVFLLQFGMNGADQPSVTINSCKGESWNGSPNPITVPSTISDGFESIKFNVSTSPFTLPCKNPYKVQNFPSEVTFLSSGGLTHISWESLPNKIYYNLEEYCVKRLTLDDMEVYICLSNCDPKYQESIHGEEDKKKKDICVSKCCNPEFVFDWSGEVPRCEEAGKIKWQPKIYKSNSLENICIEKAEYNDDENVADAQRKHSRIRYQSIIGPMCKIDPYFVYPAISFVSDGYLNPGTNFRVLDNGNLVERSRNRNPLTLEPRWTTYKQFTFCVDGLQNFHSESTLYTGESSHQLFYVCETSNNTNVNVTEEKLIETTQNNMTNSTLDTTDNQTEQTTYYDKYISISALFLSLVPLSLTLVSYWLTWDSQNIHGWTVFSHVASLFLMNLFLGTSSLLQVIWEMGESPITCYSIGVLAHFFFLSTFFWLTMVNLDLWLTFKNLKPSGRTKNGLRHIIAYALFSFLGPMLIIVIGMTLQSKYGSGGVDSDCDVIVPSYGESRCWLDPLAEGVYLYYIVGVLVLLNFIFFVLTVYVLHDYKKGTKDLKSKATQQSRELFIRLFIVMGASYTLDFISWAVHENNLEPMDVSVPWLIVDVLNTLGRAIFIFIIFACKQKTFNELRRRTSKSAFISSVLSRMNVGQYVVDDAFQTNSMKMTTVEKSRTSSFTR